MKFGVRDICNVVFKAKSTQKIGNLIFKAGQPVLQIDTATTSTMEGQATTVYANGGRGNTRLIAWEGEKTLTFTVEDALLSPMGFAILSGAGLIHKDIDKNDEKGLHEWQHVHMTTYTTIDTDGSINLADAIGAGTLISKRAPIFVMVSEADGSITDEVINVTGIDNKGKVLTTDAGEDLYGATVFVDYYVLKSTYHIHEIQISADNFGGYYYVEADTLFREQNTGKDLPANLTFPNVKIQSNFTFNMSASGDPSTFTFTMDAFPGYTMFDRTKKVLCVMQVIDESAEDIADNHTVMPNIVGDLKDFEDEKYADSFVDGEEDVTLDDIKSASKRNAALVEAAAKVRENAVEEEEEEDEGDPSIRN